MKKELVTLIWEPIAKCYKERFSKALKSHPEIAEKLAYHNGYWESKQSFNEINYRLDDNGKAFREAVRSIDRGVHEYMYEMTNVIS